MDVNGTEPDDLDEFLTEQLRSPSFRAAWNRLLLWEAHHPAPLAIDGREYRRRQQARVRRG